MSKKAFDEELLMKKFKEYSQNRTIKLRNEIIEMNLSLVDFSVSKYLYDIGIDPKELKSIGYFGLIAAVENYNVNSGIKFNTYAIKSIINYIKYHLSSVMGFNLSHYYYPILKYKKIIEKLYGIDLDKDISQLDSILKEDKYTNSTIKAKLKEYLTKRSEPLSEDNIKYPYEIEDSIIDKISYQEKISSVLESLSPKEREIIQLKYGFYGKPHTEEDIGYLYNCTHQNIHNIIIRAIKKLKKKIDE